MVWCCIIASSLLYDSLFIYSTKKMHKLRVKIILNTKICVLNSATVAALWEKAGEKGKKKEKKRGGGG